MKVTPQISADLEEYPELRTIVNAAMRPVVDLMGIHGIVSLRRMHKVGVFDHPYVKDIVVPLEIPEMPVAVKAAQYAAGKALLDYLETVGVTGVTVEMSQEEAGQLASLWAPREVPPPACRLTPRQEPKAEPESEHVKPAKPEPEPASTAEPAAAQTRKRKETTQPEQPEQPERKEKPDGEQTAD